MSDFPPRHDNSENDVVSPFPSLVESRIQRTPPPDELESVVAREEETVASQTDDSAASAEPPSPPRDKGAKSLWGRFPRPKRKARGEAASQDPKPELTPVARRLALPAAPADEPLNDSGDAELTEGVAETNSTMDAADSAPEPQDDTVRGQDDDSDGVVDATDEAPAPKAVSSQDDDQRSEDIAVGDDDEVLVTPQDDARGEAELPQEPPADEAPASQDVVSRDDDELSDAELSGDLTTEDAPEEKATSQDDVRDEESSLASTPDETEKSADTAGVSASHGDEPALTALTSPPGDDTGPGGSEELEADDKPENEPASVPVSGSFITALGDFRDTARPEVPDDMFGTAETVGAQDDQPTSDLPPPEGGQESTADDDADRPPGDDDSPDASRQLATVGAGKPSVKPTSFRGPGLPTSLTSGRSVLRFTAPQIPSSLKLRSKSGSWQPSTPPRPLMPVSAPPQSRQAPRQFWPIVALLAMPAVVVLVVVLLLL